MAEVLVNENNEVLIYGNKAFSEKSQEKTVAPSVVAQEVTADEGYTCLSKVNVEPVTSAIDSNITAENIKKDISILGVTGTLESGGSGEPTCITGDITAGTNKQWLAISGLEKKPKMVYMYRRIGGTTSNKQWQHCCVYPNITRPDMTQDYFCNSSSYYGSNTQINNYVQANWDSETNTLNVGTDTTGYYFVSSGVYTYYLVY